MSDLTLTLSIDGETGPLPAPVATGDVRVFRILATDGAGGAAMAATGVSLRLVKPDGDRATLTVGDGLTAGATGVWTADVDLVDVGCWRVVARATGPTAASSDDVAVWVMGSSADVPLPVPALQNDPLDFPPYTTILSFTPQAHWAAIRARASTYDITGALQAAIDMVSITGGGTIVLPAGRYYKPATSAAIQMKSNVWIIGEGMGITEIFFDDSAGFNHCFVKGSGVVTNVVLMDFTIRATGQTTRAENALNPVRINGTNGAGDLGDLRFERLEIDYARAVSLYVTMAARVDVVGCRILHGARDGIAIWRTPYTRIVNNTIMWCGDDGISAHTLDTDAEPTRGSIEILGNFLHQTKGIVALGAKRITVANNVLFLCYARGIRVTRGGASFEQGNTPLVGVNVSDNVISDLIAYPADAETGARQCIRIAGSLAHVGADTAYPGRPRADGTMVPLYGTMKGAFYTNDTNDGPSQGAPGGVAAVVTGNIAVRTLPAVAAATDWGYGPLWMGQHGDYSGAVSETRLAADSMWIAPFWQDLTITDNVLRATGRYGIQFYLAEDDDELDGIIPTLAFERLRILDNTIADVSVAGIRWSTAELSSQDILIEGNLIDADPRFVHTNRAANGGWKSNNGVVGISITRGGGFILRRNTFRNVRQTIAQTSAGVNIIDGNHVVGLPAADGFSTSNIGVGNMPNAAEGWSLIPEDCNPQSATFGLKIARDWPAAAAMPTAGYYLKGAVVRNSDPSSATTGWRRLTTGSAHVNGTDWLAETSATPAVWSGNAAASMAYQAASLWRITGGVGVTVTSIARPTSPAVITLRCALSAGSSFTVQDNTTLLLNGDAVLTQGSTLTLICDPVNDKWVETARTIVP